MKRWIAGLGVLALLIAVGSAWADYVFEYAEGKECTIGADVRVRLTHFDRNILNPNDWGAANGPAVEYMRVRERIWGCFDLWPDTHLKLRLVNRWHRFSSAPWDPNNQAYRYTDDEGTNTWQFPDEVIFDQLFLDMQDVTNVGDGSLSLRIGRQDIVFGNGMVWLEGTPFDQGRTIYFDGVRTTYQTEADKLDFVLVRNGYKDNWGVIANDRERTLRPADFWAAGAYWTHAFKDERLNSDLYYFYVDLNQDGLDRVPRNWYSLYEDAEIHIAGVRVFGSATSQLDYSLEYARQFGNVGAHSQRDLAGQMVDARLTMKAAEGTPGNPALSVEYTYFSGDDPSDSRQYEGWYPVFNAYPIWREELIPILLNGRWTNLHQLRTALTCELSKRVRWTGVWAILRADYGENNMDPYFLDPANAGNGDGIGHLLTTFLDIDLTNALVVRLEGSWFRPGDYWNEGHNSEWIRCELVYTFGKTAQAAE